MPPLRYLFITFLLGVGFLYLGITLSRSWCAHEKELLSLEHHTDLKDRLQSERKCQETNSQLQEKINDLQWDVEKQKRTNADLQSYASLSIFSK